MKGEVKALSLSVMRASSSEGAGFTCLKLGAPAKAASSPSTFTPTKWSTFTLYTSGPVLAGAGAGAWSSPMIRCHSFHYKVAATFSTSLVLCAAVSYGPADVAELRWRRLGKLMTRQLKFYFHIFALQSEILLLWGVHLELMS